MEIKLMMDKLSKSCDITIYLLDEDESQIDHWYGIYDNHFEKNIQLGYEQGERSWLQIISEHSACYNAISKL